MKILIYTHEFVPFSGGVATYNYELAKGLSELDQEVIVLAPRYSNEDAIIDEQMTFKVVRIRLPVRSIMRLNKNVIKPFISIYCFIKAIHCYKPDRILITQSVAHEFAAIAKLFYPFKFTLTVHGTEIYMHFSKGKSRWWLIRLLRHLKGRLMKWFFQKADSIVCVSNSTRNLLEQNVSSLQNKTSVVYNGIAPNEFSANKNFKNLLKRFNLFNQKVILTVARLSGGKGQDVVIQALPKVLEEVPNAKYLLVGDGPKRFELEKLVEKLGLEKSVLFAGSVNREQTGSFYDVCNIFIMLSRRGKKESFGLIYLEAWAHEKPVIGGNTGGVSEVIAHEKDGLLINPNNIETTAEAICRLLKDGNLAREMGEAGREKLEKEFSRQNMAQKTLDLL